MADLTDKEMTEAEQRFENMLDGVEEEYDELIRQEEDRVLKDSVRSLIYMGIGVTGIVILLTIGFYFDLYTVS